MVRFAANFTMTRIAVFGGSFDPPHLGHKALVQAALRELKLDEVWVLPVGKAVHRQLTKHISAQQRLAWVEQMFADMQNVQVLDWEVRKSVPTASIETMREVVSCMDTVPYWLMGMDAWKGLPDWVDYPEHCKLCNMVVFSRQSEMQVAHKDWIEAAELSQFSDAKAGHVYHMKVELPDISATQIRKDILTGKDVSTVLDAGVAKEIQTAYKSREVTE